jgi:SpoU rRNA methylase family enzyme
MLGYRQRKDYDGQVPSQIGKTPLSKIGTIIMYAIVVLTAIAALVSIIIPGVIGIIEDQNRGYPMLSPRQQAEHDRLLLKHGLDHRFSAIEIATDGQLYFYRDGQRCKFD